MIRLAGPDDVEPSRDVERAAGVRFAEVGMPEIAAHEPMPAGAMLEYVADGRAWVAEVEGEVVGYVLAEVVDGCGHVEQLAVAPDHQGRGHARALLDEVDRWAASRGMPAVTLTTFRDVPFNAPLYEHLGYRVLAEVELSPGLAAKRDHETELGLDPSIRVVMRREL